MKIKNISKESQCVVEEAQRLLERKLKSIDKKTKILTNQLKNKSKNLSLEEVDALKSKIKTNEYDREFFLRSGLETLLKKSLRDTIQGRAHKVARAVKKIETLICGKVNQTVFTSLENFSAEFESLVKKEELVEENIKKTNSEIKGDILNLIVMIEITSNQIPFFEKIKEKASLIVVEGKDDIKSSNFYPMEALRKKLALKCVQSSRSELSGSHNFLDDDDHTSQMFSMFMSDALNHYRLGLCLLEGDPVKIDKASSMDTASRDGLDEHVWHFVSRTVHEKSVFGPEALKEHREEIKRTTALKLKNTLHKSLRDVTSQKSRPRKM